MCMMKIVAGIMRHDMGSGQKRRERTQVMPGGVTREEHAYLPDGDRLHMLDVYRPEGAEDIPSYVLRRFYAEYVAEWLCGSASDTKSVQERYITRRLRNKLRNLSNKDGLDYDPFLEAQDCDRHTLDSLRIESDADRPEIRKVYLWDSYNKRYKEIVLRMKLEGNEWKIDDIESLSSVYGK